MNLAEIDFQSFDSGKLMDFITEYGLKVIGAILIWIIGSWIIKNILKATKKIMSKSNYEESLQKFLLNLFSWGLKILLIITLLGTLGVPTTSFAAIIAAAGLAVGMALQGSLGNFAGGVLIMIFKPFKIGDLIEAQGEIGVVKHIEIFTTKLTGLSNREIIIPNGALSNGNIINYTTEGTRRVDLVIGVSYDADIKQTKEVLMNVLTSHPKVIDTPAPSVNVLELADSSVNFAVRPWCNAEDYWTVYFECTENIKLALDAAGIEIPYPHQVEIQKKG
ncbi:mechanosensitive ion channel family protein [Aestuariibaculum lutulentum]|uniref:Mechanosensitive ion channel n=1 Tax=Aestuariibaculum lutulentum TaxID=2920935 RepID=A0ABS9RM51_9FLAO|nr:mechanosensitive ion channel domain-containing protein [Aestuariibaculum lutulentum]MCH4554031.1 mechanosensitive ion channel [Aestuariibaculum lutulentum]